jgi:predicted amidohydrolase YtcJ
LLTGFSLTASPAILVTMKVLLPVVFATAVAFAQSPATGPADAIYYHGHILTGEGLQQDRPVFVTALAIRDGKILETGTDTEVLKLAGDKTVKVDLDGAFAMPGFNDAHVHLGAAGRAKITVDLIGVSSLDEMTKRVHSAAIASPSGHWLVGFGWDHTLWTTKTLPTRQDLDAVTGNHPAIFTRVDHHIAVANSAALKAASITATTVAPAGGKIDHDANGEPTGILRETATELVYKEVPPPTEEERRRGLDLALADAVSHGITSLQDYSDWEDFLVMEKMESQEQLPARVSEWPAFDTPLEVLKQRRAEHSQDDPMLHTGMLKGFMDGSLGSRTAAMKAPFGDDPGNAGIPRYDQKKLDAMTIERAQAGFQIGFHAIGDRAASMALDAFAQGIAAREKTSSTSPRFRIEHAQVVDPADILRFKELGVIASMQPNHLLTDMNWAESRLGPQRAAYSYAWKAFLDAGVPLAFGTDYPVEPITPFRGVYAAVTRENEAGTKSYFPENRLTIGQALYAYTQGSAYAEFAENKKGILRPGYYADFVVLDRDLTAVPPAEILKAQALRTVVSGRTVYLGKVEA